MHTEINSNSLSCYMIIVIWIISIFFFVSSPDWIVVALSGLLILWQFFTISRYFVAKTLSGKLFVRIRKDRNLPLIILGAIFITIAAVLRIIEPSKAFSVMKTYSLEILLIASAIFRVIEVFLHTEIRENGILCESGEFYHWKNIESFEWTDIDDKLSVKLRNSFIKSYAKIALSSSYKKEIADSFAQYARSNYVR